MTPRNRYLADARSLLALALPLIGSHLAQMILHITDTVMLGWYGVDELAAVVLGSSTFFVLFILGSGFGIGAMGMVAAALGRGDEVQVRRDTRMAMWLSILSGLLALPVMWFSHPLLEALGQEPYLSTLAQDYLRIAGWGMVPALLIMALKSYLSALERAKIVLWATLAGAVVNVALNWALIFGHWGAPELGVRGAAVATTVTQYWTLAIMVAYAALVPGLARFRLFQRFWRPDWQAFRQVFRLGWPIGLTGLAESGLFIAAALMMGWIGTVELAAHGIAMEVAAVLFMVHLGLSNAVTIRVGRSDGEGDLQGLRAVSITGMALSMIFATVGVTMLLTLPAPIIGLFLDERQEDTAAIIAFGTKLLAMAALFQFFDAAQVMALGMLRGVRDARAPMWIAAVSYWLIGVPSSYALAFGFGMGGIGLWLGLVVGLVAAAIALLTRFWRGWGRAALPA
ncbi:MAG: MATE family efflux transporter [Rhodobacteraceae bacterium]|nr:MATE family efflux transporter [Paracoccaceae bacterium]